MVSCDILHPFLARWPEICSGDHWFRFSRFMAMSRTNGLTERLPGTWCLRFSACLCALSHLYTPRALELRLSSRVIVELLTPIALAISFLVHFLCSKTEIVYLCSEVSCLYISNAKLTNQEEISVSSFLFFTLLVVFHSPSHIGFALRRLCASCRLANLRSVFHSFKACATLRFFALLSWT